MKQLKYRLEAILLSILFAGSRTLPLDVASWWGGFMARAIGPFLKAHKIATKNLSLVFPEMTYQEKYRILTAMWDNLGRVAAELPHLPNAVLHQRVTLHGMEHLPPPGTKVVFFSGHLANWELTYPIAHRHGWPVTLIYRHANNPYTDKIIEDLRAGQCDDMLPKGPRGAIRLGRALREGYSLALLIDQKMNDGMAVPFFGRDAMTAPAIAEFALRYDMPLIPARIVRTRGCHFDAFVYPPLHCERTEDSERDKLTILTQINALLESWIREHPEQWFWVHKRWPES